MISNRSVSTRLFSNDWLDDLQVSMSCCALGSISFEYAGVRSPVGSTMPSGSAVCAVADAIETRHQALTTTGHLLRLWLCLCGSPVEARTASNSLMASSSLLMG